MAYPKVDYKGFKGLISNMNSVAGRSGQVFVFYKRGFGFVCRGKLRPHEDDMILDGELSMVGLYKRPMKAPLIIEDLLFELNLQTKVN